MLYKNVIPLLGCMRESIGDIFDLTTTSGGNYTVKPSPAMSTSRFAVSDRFKRFVSGYGLLVDSFHYPSSGYVYYPDGVEGILLFENTRMIHGKSHMWVFLIKLLHLNPDISEDVFFKLCKFVTKKKNGVVANDWSEGNALTIANEVWDRFHLGRTHPQVKTKKVLFAKGMTQSERAAIIGKLFSKGKKYSSESLLEIIGSLTEFDSLITNKEISDNAGCSLSTVSRNLTKEAKGIIKKHNNSIRRSMKMQEVSEKLQGIINESKNPKVTIRRLKELTSIRDYEIIKEVLNTVS